MSARLCQQRHIVPDGLVAIGAAEIEQLDAAKPAVFRSSQVASCVHDFDVRDGQRPLPDVTDDDKNGHVRSFGTLRQVR